MASLTFPNPSSENTSAPAFIPPRTSSHGVAFPTTSPPPSSSLAVPTPGPDGSIDPLPRKSSKRPVSTGSENWLSQSRGKKHLTEHHLESIPSADDVHSKRRHSHSHRPKPGSHHHHRTGISLVEKPLGSAMPPNQPRRDPPKTIGDSLIHANHPSWSPDKEKLLMGPYEYLFSQPGKDIRSQLITAFNKWLKVPDERLAVINKVVGMLHTSSLLVDDVEDSSLLRRGEPVAHSIFGVPQVINTANYVYFLALQQLSTLNNPVCIQIFTEELLNLHRGQGMDLFWRDTLTCPSEDDYLEMVHNKTGGLFRLAIKLMQAESTVMTPAPDASTTPEAQATAGATANGTTSPLQCVPLINTIGLLFQILDDLLNLCSTTYHSRKGHAEDLTEGKFSFPVIHAIRSDPSNLVILNVLRQKTTDLEVKRYAVEYMEKAGSFEYTRRVIAELERKAVKEVAKLEERVGGTEGKEGGESLRSILGKLKAL